MIKNNIHALLKKNGISVVDLAEQMGYTPATIYYWIKDTSRPPLETLFKLEKILNCDIHDIFYEVEMNHNE